MFLTIVAYYNYIVNYSYLSIFLTLFSTLSKCSKLDNRLLENTLTKSENREARLTKLCCFILSYHQNVFARYIEVVNMEGRYVGQCGRVVANWLNPGYNYGKR